MSRVPNFQHKIALNLQDFGIVVVFCLAEFQYVLSEFWGVLCIEIYYNVTERCLEEHCHFYIEKCFIEKVRSLGFRREGSRTAVEIRRIREVRLGRIWPRGIRVGRRRFGISDGLGPLAHRASTPASVERRTRLALSLNVRR
jgi:hypothetical protein